jgi:hypothetical protein
MGEVETPVPNAPTFRAGTTPPPDAPNGSTFTAANGLVWTKRGGLWSYEGGDTDPRIRGYGGLTPIELIGQTNAAASGQGIQKTQVGLGFLETYGIPETEAEWAALAANTGQTVAQLKSMVANDRTRYSTRKEMADFGEQRQWMTENNVKQIPYNYVYVPVSESGADGQRLRRLSFDELIARGYRESDIYGGRALYDKPGNELGLARSQGNWKLLSQYGGLEGAEFSDEDIATRDYLRRYNEAYAALTPEERRKAEEEAPSREASGFQYNPFTKRWDAISGEDQGNFFDINTELERLGIRPQGSPNAEATPRELSQLKMLRELERLADPGGSNVATNNASSTNTYSSTGTGTSAGAGTGAGAATGANAGVGTGTATGAATGVGAGVGAGTAAGGGGIGGGIGGGTGAGAGTGAATGIPSGIAPGAGSYVPTGVTYQVQSTGSLPSLPNYNTLNTLGATLSAGAASSAGGYTGSPQAMALRKQLEEQLGKLAGGNDAQRQAFDATRAARSAELTAQYGAERSKLEEELAARGLSASTIGGGRYGDLAGQQARASASFEAEMLKQQSEADARDRALYLTTMSDLAGMAGTQDLGAYEANIKAKQIESDIAFRAAELQQEAALKGRDLDLQSARDQATAQYQSGQLGLGYAEMKSREQLQANDQAFQQGESALEREQRLALQTQNEAFQKGESAADRAQRLALQTQSEAFQKGESAAERAQKQALQTQSEGFQKGESWLERQVRLQLQSQDQAFQKGESALERGLRLQLQTNDLAQAKSQAELDRALQREVNNNTMTINQANYYSRVVGGVWDGTIPLEAWDTLLRAAGLDPAKYPAPSVRPSSSNTPPPNTDTSGNPPRQENPPPAATLQNYTTGTRFNIRGVIYTLDSSGRLIDPSGRVYNYSSAE